MHTAFIIVSVSMFGSMFGSFPFELEI
jgi:hypothetical protein